jgi:hypothetical protein
MLTIWTYDWVPGGEKGPRGFVRDLRPRWTCEEAELHSTIEALTTLPIKTYADQLAHFAAEDRSHSS